MIEIKYHKDVLLFFDELTDILIEKGNNLFYITYNSNKQTTWYIFFQKTDLCYFIRYITNNHVVGQFLD